LNVTAKDQGTGKEQRIRIEASSGLTDDEIRRMRDEAKMNEAKDKAEKERIDKLNAADSIIFQTEKQLKEYGDKIPAGKKTPIETALKKLKEAHKNQDLAAIDITQNELNSAWQVASEEIYKAQQQQGASQGQSANSDNAQSGPKEPDVTDVDFEEVK
jgi:molecular chaperone DnaK